MEKFLLKYKVSSVWSVLVCCRISCTHSELICSYICLCLYNRYLKLMKLVNKVHDVFVFMSELCSCMKRKVVDYVHMERQFASK